MYLGVAEVIQHPLQLQARELVVLVGIIPGTMHHMSTLEVVLVLHHYPAVRSDPVITGSTRASSPHSHGGVGCGGGYAYDLNLGSSGSSTETFGLPRGEAELAACSRLSLCRSCNRSRDIKKSDPGVYGKPQPISRYLRVHLTGVTG